MRACTHNKIVSIFMVFVLLITCNTATYQPIVAWGEENTSANASANTTDGLASDQSNSTATTQNPDPENVLGGGLVRTLLRQA